MAPLLIGLALFLGSHFFTTQRGARAALISRLGENGYKGAYSLIAALGLVLTIYGFGAYRSAGYIQIWNPPAALTHLTMLLMLPVFILLGAPKVSWLRARTKHPMLLAVKIWATAHLLVNGDLGSMALFGAFLAWAVLARISLKRRPVAGGGAEGAPDLSGVRFGRSDAVAIIVGLVVYGVFVYWLHPLLIGVPVIG